MNFLKQVVLFITLLSSFTSCGPSESEIKAKEQKLIDSVAKVTETTTIKPKVKVNSKKQKDATNKPVTLEIVVNESNNEEYSEDYNDNLENVA